MPRLLYFLLILKRLVVEVLTVFNEFDPTPKIYLKAQEFWSPEPRFCEVGKICNCPLLMFHYVALFHSVRSMHMQVI